MSRCCCGRSALAALTLVVTLSLLAGCSGCSGGRVAVNGTVTFNGAPVDNGAISFLPIAGGEGEGVNAGGDIKDGKYAIDAKHVPNPGKYRVEIYWNKKTGKMIPTPGDPDVKKEETKQVIPPKYNTKSELTADIKSGANTLDFNLAP